MNIQEVKTYVYENDLIEKILLEIGMHSIRRHDTYISCAFPDGDNRNACCCYINENLNVTAYTRDIVDVYGCSDIISLVSFVKSIYWSNAIKYICQLVGLDYYAKSDDKIPESVKYLMMLSKAKQSILTDDDFEIKPISEDILGYYIQQPVYKWIEDGIDYETQQMFEIGFDPVSERITIPIRDETGTLVGVKGRILNDNLSENKYMYLEKCPKDKLLYGLDKAYRSIIKNGCVYVVESEKSVMKMFSYGYPNTVSIGGHKLSRYQVDMLTRLNVTVIICFDKDIPEHSYDSENIIAECSKFLPIIRVEYIIDRGNILDEKESPCDEYSKFKELNKNRSLFVK